MICFGLCKEIIENFQFNCLTNQIWRGKEEQVIKRRKHQMPLRDPTDIPFSELKNNFEPKQAWIMVSGNRKSVLMTCYGYLPDGRSYGIVEIGVWF